ncbi:MAG: hypothetical protein IKV88_00190 [Clostridia bacterium]|nr:hypothetical protein [Clostridia bacterium]
MKKCIKWVIFSFAVLFALPLLAAKLAGSSGMALCFIMFFAINPIFFVAEGIASGKEIKKHWYMPFGSALIYLLSMWMVFDMGESAFLLYAGTYFAIGTIVMLITSAICYYAAKKQIPKDKIIEQNNVTKGTIQKVTKCWWIKINTKPVRLHALDGAIFPHIMTFTYEVDGVRYKKRKYIGLMADAISICGDVDVYYDKNRPSRCAIKF